MFHRFEITKMFLLFFSKVLKITERFHFCLTFSKLLKCFILFHFWFHKNFQSFYHLIRNCVRVPCLKAFFSWHTVLWQSPFLAYCFSSFGILPFWHTIMWHTALWHTVFQDSALWHTVFWHTIIWQKVDFKAQIQIFSYGNFKACHFGG